MKFKSKSIELDTSVEGSLLHQAVQAVRRGEHFTVDDGDFTGAYCLYKGVKDEVSYTPRLSLSEIAQHISDYWGQLRKGESFSAVANLTTYGFITVEVDPQTLSITHEDRDLYRRYRLSKV